MEVKNIDEVKKWLKISRDDLEVAKVLLSTSNFSNSAYHSQQSCEKALKAVLILFGEEVFEHRVASIFYDFLYAKFPKEEIEEIYFLASKLETHWLKSRYILRSRNKSLSDPLEIYKKTNTTQILQDATKVQKLVLLFLQEEFDLEV